MGLGKEKIAFFLAQLRKSCFDTSVTWQLQEEAQGALRHTEMADADLSKRQYRRLEKPGTVTAARIALLSKDRSSSLARFGFTH